MKKIYIKPEMEVVPLSVQLPLANSDGTETQNLNIITTPEGAPAETDNFLNLI